jgi:hypothetical protein
LRLFARLSFGCIGIGVLDLALEVMKAFERRYGTGNTPSGFESGSMWLFEFVLRGL